MNNITRISSQPMTDQDQLIRFSFEELDIRGELVYLDDSWQQVLSRHDYPVNVRIQLGSALAAVALLSLTIKGSVPEKEYRVCTAISVNRLGNQLDWDINDDGSSDAVLLDGVDAVNFSYAPGTTHRSGVVSIDLTLSQGGESMRLYREVHVRNSQGKISCP